MTRCRRVHVLALTMFAALAAPRPALAADPLIFVSEFAPGDKGGEKAYRLLCDAMKKTGRVAVARWAARGKQYLVLLRPLKNVIILQQLRYPDEVRPLDEVPVGTAESKENELKLAIQLGATT